MNKENTNKANQTNGELLEEGLVKEIIEQKAQIAESIFLKYFKSLKQTNPEQYQSIQDSFTNDSSDEIAA